MKGPPLPKNTLGGTPINRGCTGVKNPVKLNICIVSDLKPLKSLS